MNHVFQIHKKSKTVTVLVHNGGGVDHQFVLNYILKKTDINTDLIMRGTKLISISMCNVKLSKLLSFSFPHDSEPILYWPDS